MPGRHPYRYETIPLHQRAPPDRNRFDDAGIGDDLRALRDAGPGKPRAGSANPHHCRYFFDLFTAIQTFRLERGAVNTGLRTSAIVDADSQKEITRLRA